MTAQPTDLPVFVTDLPTSKGKLFRRALPILDHPMLNLVISELASVRASEQYFRALAWPVEVLDMVRAASQLLKSAGRQWRELSESERRPADVVYVFGGPFLPLPNVRFAQTMQFGPHHVDIGDWPILLRDFSYETDEGLYTSFDIQGKLHFPSTQRSNLNWHGFEVKPVHPAAKFHTPKIGMELHHGSTPVYWGIGQLRVQSRWTWHWDPSENRPLIYRQTVVREKRPVSDQEAATWSEVRIYIPAFHHTSLDAPPAKVEFRRTIRQEGQAVILSLPYTTSGYTWELHPETLENHLVVTQGDGAGRSLHNFHRMNPPGIAASCETLLTLGEQIRTSPPLSLHDIAGESLLENPPTELAELFTQPK